MDSSKEPQEERRKGGKAGTILEKSLKQTEIAVFMSSRENRELIHISKLFKYPQQFVN